ncbi:uncharacterized protein LOC6563414 [Drosophila grimshawi]|uniref:GH19200 n=1 Tax=Drosophila grimshawi TaxID=7222 RepID=B4JEX5_DROGR|nr:uncharacterized protein LOC6563414 [Drosophila grimshawi]EDV93256.1 GH19200 [Drosophila grimshawi]
MYENSALTDEKLDELFVNEVRSMANIVEKLPDNEQIRSTFTHWLNIFHGATADEKFERNCILVQLHKQLNDQSKLSYPFTDPRSSQRDLRTLYQISMMQRTGAGIDEATGDSWKSTDAMYGSVPHKSRQYSSQADNNPLASLQLANKQLIEENASLVRQLLALQSQRESLLLRRRNIVENDIVEVSNDHSHMYGEKMKYLKEIFACNVITTLKLFLHHKQPNYFVTLFAIFCEDQQDKLLFEQLDKQLGHLLHRRINHHKRLAMHAQIERAYDEMRSRVKAECKQLLNMQVDNEMRKLCLTGMRCLLQLRKLLLDTYKGSRRLRRELLKFLDKAHDELANKL